jgi:DNA polymerase-4
MKRYKEISEQVFEIFRRFTPLVEPLSIDEAFLDVTGSTHLFGDPVEIAKKIKQAIVKETGLTVSAGVAPSKFVAKIASDMEKPDGLTVVRPELVREFLDPLPIKKMWGVGKVTQETLGRLSVRTFRDLSRLPLKLLERRFGRHGMQMHLLSMGIDKRAVVPDHDVKSIGQEETFSNDISDIGAAKKELLSLADKVARRMRQKETHGRTITLKVKYDDFVQITRSATLLKPTDDGPEIYSTACILLEKTDVGKRPVRLLGISLSKLSFPASEDQLALFAQNGLSQKRKALNIALDSVYEKHGDNIIGPGTLLTR